MLAASAPGLGATLTLGLVQNDDGTWRLAKAAQGESTVHSLTLTLRTVDAVGTAVPTAGASAGSVSDVSGILTQVLGEPGFDTSARAEVLSEWLQGVDSIEAGRVLEWCRSESAAVPEQPLRGPWSRVRRILGFSKLGAATAADRLLRLLQHHPPEALVRVLNERWKFGTHWNPPGQ